MDNFYSEKYHLDDFNKNSRERTQDPNQRSSRPRSSQNTRRDTRTYRDLRSAQRERAVRQATVDSRDITLASVQPSQQPPRKPKRTKKNVYRSQREKNKSAKRISRALIIVPTAVVALVLIVTACIVGYNFIINNKKNQPFRFSENVKISGIDISGLSMDAAKKKLRKNRFKAVQDIDLTIDIEGEEKSYTKTDFTYTFDYDTPLEEAKIYSQKEQGIYEPPEGSTEPEDEGELKMPNLKIEYTFNKSSAEKLSKKLSKEVDHKPVNAEVSKFHPFSDSRFEYKEGEYGFELNEDKLVLQITDFMNSGKKKATIEAEGEELKPEITVADLQEKIIGLSTATSTSYNTENGNTNMRVALEACNGSVIEPGETWSFNDCTGDSNDPKNGYKKATVITDRKLEEGYGGGICQASTTIFQAGAFANMGIAERHNHYWASGYAFSGEDATIDYPNLDVKLTNPTSYQMFIECRMDGNVLICNIYGVQEDYYDNVKLYTKNYDIVKKKSYNTETYRVLYLDGEIVSEDVICYSNYSLTDKHSVQDEDKGSFRVMVDGTTRTEADPPKNTEATDSTDSTDSTETTEETEETEIIV